VFALFAAALLAVWIEVDLFVAGSAPGWAMAIALFVLAAPVAVSALNVRRPWARPVLLAVLATAGAITLLPWHPRKRFVFTLLRVQPGMTVAEVDALLAGYLRGGGAKWHANGAAGDPEGLSADGQSGTLVYRWNDTDGAYDSDWGIVTIAGGRVTEVVFLPD